MRKFYNERGITLIALIITIIVMLILVGVTINVAMNGGLMEKAGRAKEDQQKALETEQLQDFILGKMDKNLKISAGSLGQIKIGEKTYEVTAAEGTGENAEDIEITITAGEEKKTFALERELKIKGITIAESEQEFLNVSFKNTTDIFTAISGNYNAGVAVGDPVSATDGYMIWYHEMNDGDPRIEVYSATGELVYYCEENGTWKNQNGQDVASPIFQNVVFANITEVTSGMEGLPQIRNWTSTEINAIFNY